MGCMEGRRTLIVGAASPIGSEIMRAFVGSGAMVLAVDATDEKIEAAVEALGMADSDQVITRELDESDLGSWWDLANLVDAFFDELDVFVYIPKIDTADSLSMAIDRLKQSLLNADQANPGGVSIVVISTSAEEPVNAAAGEFAREGSNIRVNALQPGAPNDVVAAVIEIVSGQGSAS